MKHLGYHRKGLGGELEVGDDVSDVLVHLVKLGVLGGHLPVLAASHRVHDVLSKKERTECLDNQPNVVVYTPG